MVFVYLILVIFEFLLCLVRNRYFVEFMSEDIEYSRGGRDRFKGKFEGSGRRL